MRNKKRCRAKCGYKRPKSPVNVSRLLAWAGNHLGKGAAGLATFIA